MSKTWTNFKKVGEQKDRAKHNTTRSNQKLTKEKPKIAVTPQHWKNNSLYIKILSNCADRKK